MTIHVVTDPRCLAHHAPAGYPEKPARLGGILELLRAAAGEGADPAPPLTLVEEAFHDAARTTVEALHSAAYIARFERAAARGDGLLDSADNPLSPGTWDAAWAAVEVGLKAADTLMQGRGPAFAAARPPGHHAEHDRAMGFCFFNNVALAAEHLRRHHGLERVAIFDFDVHHGNGTQHLFEERSDVLYASTHQYPFYPGTGGAAETGKGEGRGATLNVPLAAGTGDEAYLAVLADTVLPALESFRPDALLISAGFDAWRRDPLGGLALGEGTFHHLGREIGRLAGRLCGGRVLSVLEGGYDLAALPRLVATYLRGLRDGLGEHG